MTARDPAPGGGSSRPSAAAVTPDDVSPSARHVLGRIAVLDLLARSAADGHPEPATVGPRGAPVLAGLPDAPPAPADAAVRNALAAVERAADQARADGHDLRLRRLATTFALTPLDLELLLVVAAPDVDPGVVSHYEHLLPGDAGRLTPAPLAFWLTGLHAVSAAARTRYGPAGHLAAQGLLSVERPDDRWSRQVLRVPERVIAHLLGEDVVPDVLRPLLADVPALAGATAERIGRALAAGVELIHLLDPPGGEGMGPAVAAVRQRGGRPIVLELPSGSAVDDLATLARLADREARLGGGALIVGPVDALGDGGHRRLAALTELPGTVVLVGRLPWDPDVGSRIPLQLTAERISDADRSRLWTDALGGANVAADAAATTALYRLAPEQIVRAVRSAQQQAAVDGRSVEVEDLQRGARAQNATALSRLARRITPGARWDDLVLPPLVDAEVRDLLVRWRHRGLVLDRWGMSRGTGRGRGVTALFAGEPGTGKTLSAEVLAGELGLDLYVIELSTVVDKYIGETSKNLERIFAAADRVNGVLLFDEADALFGKRSAVSDAKDRHANVEVAYLLQRLESFDGIAILTTNLASNLDDAFLRRLDAIVDFPSPDVAERLRLWQTLLPDELPRSYDLDLGRLAEQFRLSGAEIRNAVTTAAYRAAAGGREVTMEDLVLAVVREHRKLGRRLTAADLGRYAHLADP